MRIVRDSVAVRVPATLSGIGAGGPRAALALGLSDVFEVRAVTMAPIYKDPFTQALFAGLEAFGAPLFRPEISRTNRIPARRGLGDWTAHTVAGLVAAKHLLGEPADFDVLELASKVGANPVQARASLEGGFILGDLRVEPPSFVKPTLFVPDFETPEGSSQVLPSSVRFERASKAVEAAALLGAVIGGAGTKADLLEATADHVMLLHLATVAPASAALVDWLRECDLPAFLSGAGSAVACLTEVPVGVAAAAKASGWRIVPTTADSQGTILV